ncbi:MAG: right-handed parallel beta-helix repeat-containing protein [Nitrospirales bacterium]
MNIEKSDYLRIALLGALFTLCACSMWAFPTQASLYHVAVNGQDLTSCQKGTNPQTPRQSIGGSLRCLSPGDTLYVHSGTYGESILSWKTKIPNGKGWDKPITVAVYPGDVVTITPRKGHAFFWINDGQAKYLIIDGFIIDGENQALHGFKFHENTRYVRIQNTEVKNSTASGILVTPGPGRVQDTYHEFINMKVHHNGQSRLDHGFYVTTSSNLFEKNEVFLHQGYGIHIYQSKENTANNNVIRHNIVHNNGLAGWSCGILLSSGEGNIAHNNIVYENFIGLCSQYRSTNAQFYNNIAYENRISGIYVGDKTNSQTGVYNNTIYKNGTQGIFIGDGARKAQVKNNIVYLNGAHNIFEQEKGKNEASVSHNLMIDPRFVNAQAHDFRLQPGSPAIGGGIFIDGITLDNKAITKQTGEPPDIGAFAYHSIETAQKQNPKALADIGQRGSILPQVSVPADKPTLVSPPAGSILSGSTETFSWSTVPAAQEYFLQIGTGLGQPNEPLTKNIFNATVPASQDSVVVHQLPTNGMPLYVRFWYKQDNQWIANEQVLFRAGSSPMGNLPNGPR